MKKIMLFGFVGLMILAGQAVAIEQTICFSQRFIGVGMVEAFPNGVPQAALGDSVSLNGGRCNRYYVGTNEQEGVALKSSLLRN